MAEKIYKVKGPDGILEVTAPDNASKIQIELAAKRQYEASKRTAVPTKTVTKEPELGYSATKAAKAPARMEQVGPGLIETLLNTGINSIKGKPLPALRNMQDYLSKFPNMSANDILAELALTSREGASAASGAAATIASAPTGPYASVIGSGTMAYMDQILRYATGQETGSSLTDNPIAAGAIGTVENELGNKLLTGIGKVARGKLVDQIPGMTDELKNLKPTYGQATKKPGFGNTLENFLAPSKKTEGVQESTKIAKSRITQLIDNLTNQVPNRGRHGFYTTRSGTSGTAELIKAENRSAFQKFVSASNKEADNAIAISEMFQIPGTQKVTSVPNPTPIFGGPKTITTVTPGKPIAGPIYAKNAIPELVEIRKELIPSALNPNADNKVLRDIEAIFSDMNAVFDEKGNLFSYDPMSFKQAWKAKQTLDKLGYGDLVENLNIADSRFKRISAAFNDDIDQSIPKWSKKKKDQLTLKSALDSWHNSKAIVSKRHELFSGTSSKGLLNSIKAPSRDVDTMLNDYKEIQKFLERGESTVNGKRITSTNARRDLQGYKIEKIFDDSWTPTDINDRSIGTLDGDKLASNWVNFLESPEGKVLFGAKDGQTVAKFNEFFDAVKRTSAAPDSTNRWVKMNIGNKILSFSPAIFAGSLGTGNIPAASVTGAGISMAGLAKVLTSKKYGPALLGIMKGKPLGMSFQAASRGIMQSLSGSHITLDRSDGTQTEVIMGTDGILREVK